MSQLNNIILSDWGSIALVCPCQKNEIVKIESAKDLNGKCLVMDISKPRQVDFVCNHCQNSFDYEVKIRLFELLKQYYELHKSFEGFSSYITRKNQRIRLKYIKTIQLEMKSCKKTIIVIEAANLTKHPEFKK